MPTQEACASSEGWRTYAIHLNIFGRIHQRTKHLPVIGPVRLSYNSYFSAFFQSEQYFSLTTNQRTVLSAMAFQRSEQGQYSLDRKEGMSLRLKKRAESI